jgi:hypothetical protein
MSHPDLSSFFMSLFWFGQSVSWGGHSMLFILCFILCVVFLCVWPGMVPNQRQLSIVVSDWEPYLGSLFSHLCLWVVVFCLVFCTRQNCFVHSLLLLFSFSVQFLNKDEHVARCTLVLTSFHQRPLQHHNRTQHHVIWRSTIGLGQGPELHSAVGWFFPERIVGGKEHSWK